MPPGPERKARDALERPTMAHIKRHRTQKRPLGSAERTRRAVVSHSSQPA